MKLRTTNICHGERVKLPNDTKISDAEKMALAVRQHGL